MLSVHRILIASLQILSMAVASNANIVCNGDPLIYYHGRWDKSPGTWWAGSGFKLNIRNLKSLALDLGNHTTTPFASIGVSLNYNAFVTVNVSEGINNIPLESIYPTAVVRINVEGWQDNRINMNNIILNEDSDVLPYTPSSLAFLFIGDSLSAGQYLPQGVDQAWPFLTGEHFHGEHTVIAQPGAALSDIVSYGNEHGVSYQFFRTEDTGYFYTTDHNYTTPWEFKRDIPTPTHIVIHIGANDASQNVSAESFAAVYVAFVRKLRILYPRPKPIFVFTPWGWPQPDGSIDYYYTGSYDAIVHTLDDESIYIVNTTGWITYEDVFADNLHPTVQGHVKIADEFIAWLERWGIS